MGKVFVLAETKLPPALECQRVFGEMLRELEGWVKVANPLPSVQMSDGIYHSAKAGRYGGQSLSPKGGETVSGTAREGSQVGPAVPLRSGHPHS